VSKKIKWSAADADGVRRSKCGLYRIIKREDRWGRSHVYDAYAIQNQERQTGFVKLDNAKRWCEEAPSRAFPRVYYTFAPPPLMGSGSYSRDVRVHGEPSAHNGAVNVVRYKITVEPIDEPEEIEERIKRLWRECNNSHLWGPLRGAAAAHGVELNDKERGADVKRDR